MTVLNETFIKNGANIRHSKCKNGREGKKKEITVTDVLKNHKKVTSLYFALLCGVWLHLVDPVASGNTWDDVRRQTRPETHHQGKFEWHAHFQTWLQGSSQKVEVGGATISWQTCPHHTHATIFSNKKNIYHLNYCTIKMHWIDTI